jgi:hypothetical protein
MTDRVHGMGKDFQHVKEIGGPLMPLNPSALRMTWLGQNRIDVLCIRVELMSKTEGRIETD